MSNDTSDELSSPDPRTTKSSEALPTSEAGQEQFRDEMIAQEYDSLGDGVYREMYED
ncbi:hypothetical protein [Rathayibacter sp. AY1A7]|uniref:hypothetical protein n=1 Tax=Rathayibacter sp. AY1A7 TaxID=2080524 RepID=UPI0015E411F6|nr:hypothetical protein [Rathayibacter sp. AY1A7]